MHIQSNYHNNINTDLRSNFPNFKGEVSPEFCNYVNTIRNDCLEYLCQKKGTTLEQCNLHPVPIPGIALVNDICDRIIDNAKRIMEECFHSESVISVDTTQDDISQDIFILSDKRIEELAPGFSGVRTAYIPKRELSTPLKRLKNLNIWCRGGDIYADAYCKLPMRVINSYEEHKANGNFNKGTLKQILWLFDFWNQHVDLLDKEIMPTFHNISHIKPWLEQYISEIQQRLEKEEIKD